MKTLHLAAAAALVIGSSGVAFTQDYVDAPGVIGGGAVGTCNSAVTR